METGKHLNAPYDFSGKDLEHLFNYLPLPLHRHSQRVAVCSSLIAGYANEIMRPPVLAVGRDLEFIAYLGGMCHDIGKLLIPEPVMEAKEYRHHPAMGVELLKKCQNKLFEDEIQAQMVMEIVRYHHERPDGAGFPEGLKAGGGIPLTAGICTLADWLDYRCCPELPGPDADGILAEIRAGEGTLFFASIINCLEYAWDELREQYEKWGWSWK